MEDNILYLIKTDNGYYSTNSQKQLELIGETQDFTCGFTNEQLETIDREAYAALLNPILVVSDNGVIEELPKGCGTCTTTDTTNVDLHGYSGVISIKINADSTGGRYIISFDKRKTWYTREEVTLEDTTKAIQWVAIPPTDIYTRGMTMAQINALTKIDYAPIFQPTQLDMMIAVGTLPGEPTECYCTGFEVNLPENAPPAVDNVVLSHAELHKGNIQLSAQLLDYERDVISYKLETFAKRDLIDTLIGGWKKTADKFYTGNYCLTNSNQAKPSTNCDTSTTVTLETATQLSFYYAISSESGDYLRFYVDNVQKLSVSGVVDWTLFTIDLAPGTHTLKWSYMKNGSTDGENDSAYIDEVILGTQESNRKMIKDWTETNVYDYQLTELFHTDYLVPGKNTIRIHTKDSRGLESYFDHIITVTNTFPVVGIYSLNGQRLLLSLSDKDGDDIVYRILINGEVLSEWSASQPSPIQIDFLIPLDKIKIAENNIIRIEFKDSYGTEGQPFELTFEGKYYGLLFKDEASKYYSDSLGGILQKLVFDPMFAGQISLPKKVILENNTGFAVNNVINTCPEEVFNKVHPEMSLVEDPFNPVTSFVISRMNVGEEKAFFVRIRTEKESVGSGDFAINTVSDVVG